VGGKQLLQASALYPLNKFSISCNNEQISWSAGVLRFVHMLQEFCYLYLMTYVENNATCKVNVTQNACLLTASLVCSV